MSKKSKDCGSCVFFDSCANSEGTWGKEHGYDCFVLDTPESRAFQIHCAIEAGDYDSDDEVDKVYRIIDSKIVFYREWLKKYPYDFQKHCSQEYMTDRIIDDVIASGLEAFTKEELKEMISEFIGALEFEEVVGGRTYSFAKAAMS